MKKIISILVCLIVCAMVFPTYAAEDMDYLKVYEKVSVKLPQTEATEAVLVVSQFKSGKLVDMKMERITQPGDGYTMPTLIIKKGIDYNFCVYDNLSSMNVLFNPVVINSETQNQLFLAEYEGHSFERVKED